MMIKHLYLPSISDYVKEHLIRQIIQRPLPPAFTEETEKEKKKEIGCTTLETSHFSFVKQTDGQGFCVLGCF